MIKRNVLVSFDAYSEPNNPGIPDEFRNAFGSWGQRKTKDNIEYITNDNKPFKLEESQDYILFTPSSSANAGSDERDFFGMTREEYDKWKKAHPNREIPRGWKEPLNLTDIGDPIPEVREPLPIPSYNNKNHLIVVPTEGSKSIIYAEQIYRQSFYVVERTSDTSLDPLNLMNFGIRYTNFATDFATGNSYSEIKSLSNIIGDGIDPDIINDVEFIYKSELPEYETSVANAESEFVLPNLYEVKMNSTYTNGLNNINTIFSDIENQYYSDPNRRRQFTKIIVPPDTMKKYSEITGEVTTYIDNGKLPKILETHQVVTDAQDPTILEFKNDFAKSIPYLARIKVGSPDTSEPKIVLDNYMLFSNANGQDNLNSNEKQDIGTLLMRWHCQNVGLINDNYKFTWNNPTVDPIGNFTYSPANVNFKTYELIKWFNEFAISAVGSLPSDSIFLTQNNFDSTAPIPLSVAMAEPTILTIILVLRQVSLFLQSLGGTIAIEDIIPPELSSLTPFAQNYTDIHNKLYTYEEMIKCGGSRDSEVLFYKIDKYDYLNVQENSRPLQTIYIPNIRPYGKDYIDTQVKYGKYYTYKISEVRAILGCEYEYVEVPQPDILIDTNKYLFAVKQYPRIRIAEIPVYQKSGRILAAPPLPPQFEIIPVRRRQNTFKIFFKTSYGSAIEEVPNPINNQSSIDVRDILANDSLFRSKVKYSDDLSVTQFDVYYSETKPKNPYDVYGPLKDSLYTSVLTDIDPKSKLGADSATAIMKLIPNTKYYFTFVATNKYGLSSNPTAVYEFEMINDSGYSYLDFKEVTYTEEEINFVKKPNKSVYKLFSIKPNTSQTEVNFEESKLVIDTVPQESRTKSIVLGSNPDKLFAEASPGKSNDGKILKIRIRSNSTNRCIDLNVTFKHERIESNFDRTIPANIQEVPNLTPSGTSLEDIASRGFVSPKSFGTLNPLQNSNNYNCIRSSVPTSFFYPETQASDPINQRFNEVTDLDREEYELISPES